MGRPKKVSPPLDGEISAFVSAEFRVPPSVNALTRNIPGKGRAKTNEYKSWLHEARLVMALAGFPTRIEPGAPEAKRPWVATIQVNINRTRDIDNVVKAVLDAHSGSARKGTPPMHIDDRWCDTIIIERNQIDIAPGMCRFSVALVEPVDA